MSKREMILGEAWNLPREVGEVKGKDPGTYLQFNSHMVTFYQQTYGELSRFFLALREGRLIGSRCPRCGQVNVPAATWHCPTCDFVEMEEVDLPHRGVLAATAPITIFPSASFIGDAPFARGYVDVATDAHPEEVHRLMRRSRMIGRRFKLVHAVFHDEIVEVSTFRSSAPAEVDEESGRVLRDNVFGNREQDAARRDFTVNALYYDPANETVLDYHKGVADLKKRTLRIIGDPAVRFREDPVRMLRAVAIAARLDFAIDADTAEAVRSLRGEIVRSSSARILEEFYKILRQGRSRRTFEMLHEHGLLAYLLPEADRAIAAGGEALLSSLARLDAYRQAGLATPDQLTNPIVMGSLVVPLGIPLRRVAASTPRRHRPGAEEVVETEPPRTALSARQVTSQTMLQAGQ